LSKDFREIGKRLSNWGRWGPEDERGTVNFITPERIVEAAKLIKTGKVFDLGIPFGSDGPQPGIGGRINPVHIMTETGADQHQFPGAFHYADDYVYMPLQAASQWDGLSHVFYDDYLYNGFPASEVTIHGARRCSIDKLAKGISGRGVLLDVARHRGVDWMQGNDLITPDELDTVAANAGVEVKSGDILCLRTGWRKKFVVEKDALAWYGGEPGIGVDCCQWLHDHEVAAVACDNIAVEVSTSEVDGELLPVHMILIRDMGMTLGEILDFEELADDCAADGVYEFFLSAPPIQFTGAVGSPINPQAIK
jgi:kynurenine formamidase